MTATDYRFHRGGPFSKNNKMSRLSTIIHPLLTEIIIDSLFEKHIYTTFHFIDADIKRLCSITNLSYKNILIIRKHIINKSSAVVRNGYEYYKEIIKKSSIIPTGIKKLDECLEGGLCTGTIYEVFGLPGTGKTQCCLTLAKNIAHNLSQHLYFLDTKRDFSPKRLKNMCESKQILDVEIGEILSKILVKQISNANELANALHEIKDEIKRGLPVKLIIIDSLPSVLYQYPTSADFNAILNRIVNLIRFLSVELHVCFVITNVYTTWYEDWTTKEQSNVTEKIGCGKYWLNIPNVRLKFSKISDAKNEYEILLEGYSIRNKKINVCIGDIGMY